MDKRLAERLLLGERSVRAAPDAGDLFSVATQAGATILDALVGAFPLHGRATTSLSTALRTRAVMQALDADA
eukprot:1922089-Alexandrium_andersonii.AAC.1